MIRALLLFLELAQLGTALTLLWFLVAWSRRSPVFGLGLSFIPVLAQLFAEGLLAGVVVGVSVGSVTFYPADLVAITYLVAVVERTIRGGRPATRVGKAAAVFLGVITISLLRGIVVYDLTTAMVQFRPYLYFAAAVLYFAGHPFVARDWSRLARLWIVTGVGLTTVALGQSVLPLRGIFGAVVAGPGGTGRPLNATQAFIILMAVLLALHQRYPIWMTTSLMIAVVALQHRSVWVAAAAGLSVMALGSERRQLSRLGGVLTILLLALTIATPAVFESLTAPLDRAAQSTGTWQWRVEGWNSSIEDQLRSPGDWLVGHPMGTPWSREVAGSIVSVSPHSMYVELLLRSGLVGVAGFVLIPALLAASTRGRDRRLASLTLAVVAAQLIYAVPYKPDSLQGALLGALAMILMSSVRPREAIERRRAVLVKP